MSGAAAFASAVDVSRETLDRLERYAGLLATWNPRINLVSKSTLGEAWTRHFSDSAQIFDALPDDAGTVADFGSGAGFPGLVVAILAAEKRPGLKVVLVESDQRKAVFLRTVAQEVGVAVDVRAARIEEVSPLAADVVMARALAPLTMLLGFAERHLAQGGTALFLKGASWRDEVAKSLAHWRFRCEDIPSKTAADAVVLKLGDIQRA